LFSRVRRGALSGNAGAGLLHGLKTCRVAIVAAGGVGPGAHTVPGRERASIAVLATLNYFAQRFVDRPDRVHSARGVWVFGFAVVRRHRLKVTIAMHGSRARDWRANRLFFVMACRLADRAEPFRFGRPCSFRRLLTLGARWCSAAATCIAAAARSVRRARWVSDDAFLAGYGARRRFRVRLFTFAGYLASVVRSTRATVPGARWGCLAFSSPASDTSGCIAVFGIPFAGGRTAQAAHAWSERVGRRTSWCGALQPDLDDLGQKAPATLASRCWLRSSPPPGVHRPLLRCRRRRAWRNCLRWRA